MIAKVCVLVEWPVLWRSTADDTLVLHFILTCAQSFVIAVLALCISLSVEPTQFKAIAGSGTPRDGAGAPSEMA
jgi:hypothetical protein